MAGQPALNRPFVSSNTNVPPQMLAQADEAAPQADQTEEEAQKPKERAGQSKRRGADKADAAEEAEPLAKERAPKRAERSEDPEAGAERQPKRRAPAESSGETAEPKAAEPATRPDAAEEAETAKPSAKENAPAKRRASDDDGDRKDTGAKTRAEPEASEPAAGETVKEPKRAGKATQDETGKAATEGKTAPEKAVPAEADTDGKTRGKKDRKQAGEAETAPASKEAPAAKTPARGEPKPAPDQPDEDKASVPAPGKADGSKPAAPARNGETAKPGEAPESKTGADRAAPAEDAAPKPDRQDASSPLPENAAPVLDSDKPAKGRDGKDRDRRKGGRDGEAAGRPAGERPAAEAPATPVAPPKSDADVQQELRPVKIEPVRTEKGTRMKERRRDERPSDVQVIKQFDNRTIVEVDNNIFVEGSDRPRMSRNAQDVYYEDLPRNRTRETIVRDNGVEIVTIRNRYGDVIQRSRVTSDGREVILSYAPDYDREERTEWRDPGDDLPPLHLTIPVREYIMDAEEVPEEDVYEFFSQPPVERVERLYSIDEVKRSARIRDKVRRVDLDTITFPFGSAEIGEDQIARIESVAKAMAQTLEKNPAETF
ncbi:MAG: hypothetical protein ACREIP_04390, partial [Alphaproteobacteria bacterium]